MRRANFVHLAALIGSAIAGLQGVAFATPPTIYFNTGGSIPSPQLTAGAGAHQGTFSATNGADTLAVTGSNSVYVPGYITSINSGSGDATDYVKFTGFNPTTDDIYFALKLDNNGSPINPSLDAEVITAINSNPAYAGAVASAVTGAFTNVFAGYDILLSFPNNGSRPAAAVSGEQFDFGFDFSSYTDAGIGGGSGSGITVTDIGLVPEPACLGLLTAAGLILLPRYRRRQA